MAALKPVPIDLDQCTPVKGNSAAKFGGGLRSSISSAVFPKLAEAKGEIPAIVTPITKKLSTSRRIIKSPFPSAIKKKKISTSPPHLRSPATEASPAITNILENPLCSSLVESQPFDSTSVKTSLHMNLPGKLSMMGKEAVHNCDKARKFALRALRDASSIENLIRCLEMFSNMIRIARPDSPASTFDQFLKVYEQLMQTLAEMASILGITEPKQIDDQEYNNSSILQEIKTNLLEQSPKRKANLRSSSSINKKKTVACHVQSVSPSNMEVVENDENKKPTGSHCSVISSTIELGKRIGDEAGNWFMEFLEKAMENGLNKSKGKVCESVLLKVLNWVEVEQCESGKKILHPKAQNIANKLRVKVNNP